MLSYYSALNVKKKTADNGQEPVLNTFKLLPYVGAVRGHQNTLLEFCLEWLGIFEPKLMATLSQNIPHFTQYLKSWPHVA